jgi:tRNA 2-thiouridine synthesizing protein A
MNSEMMPQSDHELDVRGLQCPLPVLKARKRLQSVKIGETLKILATDLAATIDFPHYCSESGNELAWSGEDQGVLVFIIRKTHGK